MPALTIEKTILISVLFTVSAALYGQTAERDFEINDSGTITKYLGWTSEVDIPPYVRGRPVTAIGERVFAGYALTRVSIPSTVTRIAKSAFTGNRLKSVGLPANFDLSPQVFGDVVFYGYMCNDRKAGIYANDTAEPSVRESPEGFKYIETAYGIVITGGGATAATNGAATSGARFVIPEKINNKPVKVIGSAAFSGREDIQRVFLPPRISTIGNGAFTACENLTEIALPSGVVSIGKEAFFGCASLTSIAVPRGVTLLAEYAFSGCTALSSVTLSPGITLIGSGAFYNCSSLASISLPYGITAIESGAFSGCSSLTEISIPSSVASIGEYAFSGCGALAELSIPPNLDFVGEKAFATFNGFEEFYNGNGLKAGIYTLANSRWSWKEQ
jgi:hypothetical protein